MFQQPASSTSKQQQPNATTQDAIMDEWMDATLKTAQSLDPFSYLPDLFWKHRTRPDGRIFGQARPTSVVTSVLQQNALGSALVTFQSQQPPPQEVTQNDKTTATTTATTNKTTHVLAGVTADVGQPSSVAGDLRVTLVPSHPPLESWLQRLLLASLMDLEQLGIVPGKAAFGLDLTLCVLNADGNVRDACLLAAVAALQDTTLPAIVVQDGRVYTLPKDASLEDVPQTLLSFPSKNLVLGVIPVPLSMGSMSLSSTSDGDSDSEDPSSQQPPPQHFWLVDPSREEETVCEGSMSVVINALAPEQVLSLEYQGSVSVTHSALALALRMAQGRAEELLPLLINESSQ